MRYTEVILPLPLEGTFTYAVPDSMQARVTMGVRVVVPLGKSKTYTAMAVCEPHGLPDGLDAGKVRPLLEVLDDHPVLLPQQLRLWQWIADYYLSPLGDVMKAALPSGMKSEEGYRPRVETYVALDERFRHPRALDVALQMVARAPKQQQVLRAFLAMSRGDGQGGGTTQEEAAGVTRDELINESHCTMATVKALVDRGILRLYDKEVGRIGTGGEPHPECVKRLSDAQADAYNQILMQMLRRNVVLLQGVTSSGKTEIYIHLIEKAIADGKQVLYLLPEIALTVQITSRLRKVFGDRLGIYHSKYSDAERVEIWKKQLSGHPYDVILGARSAVFLPFQRLGLVIIDEEHETSFKQQDPAPRYHARSAAIVLASMYGAKTLLGTATPSAESLYNARTGKYGLVRLTTRYAGMELPEIEVVDIKDLRRRKMMNGPFSPQLLRAVREALEQGRQVILFQNRRGFAPMVECKVCGWVPKCKNCDVTLTLHKTINRLTCHYCGFTYPVPTVCPNCGSTELSGRGYGTEKIEDQIREIFPEARVARMDLDTTRSRNAYSRIIGEFSAGKTNVLVGTQMISKGLDFDKVSVVGILDADSMLNWPDFRAYEHAFMMMSQVAGRAGRKGQRGLVVLQTKSPDLPVVQQIVGNDGETFFHDLLEERRAFHYPPFCHLVYIYLRHRQEPVVEMAAQEYGSRLRQWFGARVLGPDKPVVARVKSMSIRKLMLKLENGIDQKKAKRYLRLACQQMMEDRHYSQLQVYYDVDPL